MLYTHVNKIINKSKSVPGSRHGCPLLYGPHPQLNTLLVQRDTPLCSGHSSSPVGSGKTLVSVATTSSFQQVALYLPNSYYNSLGSHVIRKRYIIKQFNLKVLWGTKQQLKFELVPSTHCLKNLHWASITRRSECLICLGRRHKLFLCRDSSPV